MASVEIRAYRAGDGFRLAAQLRDQDKAELDAAGHTNHYGAILESVKRSEVVLTAEVDGRLAAVLGLSRAGTALAPYGVPWMLGTPLVPKHRRALARLAPRYIRAMLQVYPVLRNLVHADNTVAQYFAVALAASMVIGLAAPLSADDELDIEDDDDDA